MLKFCGFLLKNEGRFCILLSGKINCSILQTPKSNVRHAVQRNAVTSIAGPGAPSMKNEEKITPMGWFLLLAPITTFGLGCWQWKRKVWKEQLIKSMEVLTKTPPVELPEDLSKLKDMEYRVVKVKGTFLHDKELFMGPRSLVRPEGGETAGGLLSQRDVGNGYWVITPFKLADRDDIVLINRGWIPRNKLKPESRLAGQITDEIEMVCVVRKGEKKPKFMPEHKNDDVFLYRDIGKMSVLTGAQPVFLDASYLSSVPGGPIGGQTRLTLRNEHLSYLITWYSLSLATGYLWYRNILKRKSL